MTLQNIKISLRSDSLENWISSDPVLKNGELVMVNDISAGLVRFKVGNGVSAFVQLPYVNEKKVITDFAKIKRTESQYFSQGVNNFASPLGFAAGSYLTADSSFAQVLGINACAQEGHDYSFVWNGDSSGTIGVQSYMSHGEGTFNVNPAAGVNGFYVGDRTLSGILSSTCQPKGNYLSSSALDGYRTYDSTVTSLTAQSGFKTYADTKSSLSGDGYATQAQLDAKSAVSVDNELADVNILHISQEEYNQLVAVNAALSNTVYIISSDYVEAYGQRIKNVAPGADLSDAVNLEQLSDAINGISIPADLSAFTNSPGYTTNAGTITGITMNGASRGISGNVDLGTVLTAHQSLSNCLQNNSSYNGINLTATSQCTFDFPYINLPDTSIQIGDLYTESLYAYKHIFELKSKDAGNGYDSVTITNNPDIQIAHVANDEFEPPKTPAELMSGIKFTGGTIGSPATSSLADLVYTKSETSSATEVANALSSIKIDYDSNARKIVLSAGSNATSVDCNDFIKDGMLSTVGLRDKQLVFNFNTDAGVQPISVALSNFIDETQYWTKSETSSAAELSDAFSAKADISSSLISVEWADLTALVDAEELVPGQKYRITDYVTTVDQEDCRSAGHPFDLIVTAIDHHTLDEHAVATLPSDGDDYFDAREYHVPEYQQYLEYARVPLESWDIKYCLDNDKTRFRFADAENGKGVIYYMKDEFGNEAPYDFKNVQFKRYLITSSPGAYGLEGMYGLAVGSIEVDTSDEMWCYTFSGADYADFGFSEPYDFSGWHVRPTQAVIQQFGGPSIERLQECTGNVILERQEDGDDFSLMSFKLPNNVFHCALDYTPVSELPFIKIGYCYANKLGNNCYNNTFGNSCHSNTFGNYCDGNTFSDDCSSNTFGIYYNGNTFGNSCHSNTFGNYCYGNTFGNNCDSNTFGNYCDGNTFGSGCNGNTFSDDCDSNTFGNYCYGNTFGNNCDSNTFGNYCYGNIFGNECRYIKFASTATSDPSQAKNYYRCINIDSGNQYIILDCTQSTYDGNEYKNVRILPGVNNTTSYETITDSNVNQSFCTTYQPANSQVIAV